MNFEDLLEKVNVGWSERNLVGQFDSRLQRFERNLKEIGHWGGDIAFFKDVNNCTICGVFTDTHDIRIIRNFASRTTAYNQTVC